MPQFGASLTDNATVTIYDRNVFIKQAPDDLNRTRKTINGQSLWKAKFEKRNKTFSF